MIPIVSATGNYDERMITQFDELAAGAVPPLRSLLPQVLTAGAAAGSLTAAGAALLDPSGALQPGIPMWPPEGDADTSVFAMFVLERRLQQLHHELDLVTPPAGDTVAMVHCNNSASELGQWMGLFQRFSEAAGPSLTQDQIFETVFRESLTGDADAGGLLAYNYVAGEHIVGLTEGRPLVMRTPDSNFTLANLVRAHLYGVFATLALGMQVLEGEGVEVDRMFAHGGLFRTAGVAQRFLAAAIGAPVAVGSTASEGGAWGVAVLAAYRASGTSVPLGAWLDDVVFADAEVNMAPVDAAGREGFLAYLERFRAGLTVEAAAVVAV